MSRPRSTMNRHGTPIASLTLTSRRSRPRMPVRSTVRSGVQRQPARCRRAMLSSNFPYRRSCARVDDTADRAGPRRFGGISVGRFAVGGFRRLLHGSRHILIADLIRSFFVEFRAGHDRADLLRIKPFDLLLADVANLKREIVVAPDLVCRLLLEKKDDAESLSCRHGCAPLT